MSKLRRVATLPKQSLVAMKVAFGARTQYATITALSLLLVTQVIGVAIFSGEAQANGSVAYAATITNGFGDALDGPAGIVVAPDDSFYVASSGNGKIYKYNSSGVPVAAIGTPGSGDGQLNSPGALALDGDGNLFVFDRSNVRVQKFDSSGNFVTKWGSTGTGDGQFVGAYDGYGRGIAVAPNGDVYVVDHANDRIQVFDNDGTFLRKWSVSRPFAIAVDAAGRVWSHGGPYTAYGQPIGGTTGELCEYSMTISPAGDMYCPNNYGQAIKLNVRATARTRIATWGSGIALMDSVAADSHGKIYATNVYSNQVQVYDDHSTYVQATTTTVTDDNVLAATLNGNTSIAGVTAKGFQFGKTTDYELPGMPDTSTPPATLIRHLGQTGTAPNVTNTPQGLAIASDGNYFVADGNPSGYNIKKLRSTDGYLLGTIDAAYYGINPGSMTVDSQGNLYVINVAAYDDGTDYIWKFNSSGSLVTSWGATGTGDGEFRNATGIAVDSRDNIYVVDKAGTFFGSSRIQKFNSSGTYVTKWGSSGTGDGQFSGGVSIAVGADDSVYALDILNDRIQKFNSSGTFISKWGNPGSGDGHWSSDHVSVMSISGNRVYIGDNHGLNRLLTFTTDGAFVSSAYLKDNTNDYLIVGQIKVDDLGNLVMQKATNDSADVIQVYKPDSQVLSLGVSDLDCGTTYHYRAYATNTYGTVYGADQQFDTDKCVEITTTSLPNADLGQEYSQEVMHNNTGWQVFMHIVDGDLPPGMIMDHTGSITDYPTETGLYTFTVEASNLDHSISAQKELSIFVNGESLGMTNISDVLTVGETYSSQIQSTGGVGGEVSFSVNPANLPPGLSMDSSGTISGTPTEPGSYSATVGLTETYLNAYGVERHLYGYGSVQFEVTQQDPPHIIGGGISGGRVGTVYSSTTITNSVYGGFGYKSFEVTGGDLPPGLSFDVDGSLHGTPTTAGYYAFTVEVSDITGSDSAEFTITILPALTPRTNTPIVTITSPPASTVFDYTHDNVTITGTGPANQTITTYMDNYELGTTTSDSSGNWTYVAHHVFPGDHNVEAKWIPVKDVAFVPFIRSADTASEVKVIDTASRQLIKTILLPLNSYVTAATINHAGTKVYISGFEYVAPYAPRIWEFDVSSGSLARTLTIPDYTFHPSDLQITSDDQYAYINKVTQDNLVLIKINLESLTVAASPINIPMAGSDWNTIQSGFTQIPLALADQSVYVSVSKTNSGTADMTIIDQISQLASGSTASSEARESSNLWLVAEAGDNIYTMINKKLVLIDPTSNAVLDTIIVNEFDSSSNRPASLTVDTVHGKAYVGTLNGRVYIINLTTDAVSYVSLAGDSPYNIASPYSLQLTSDASQVYVVGMYGSIQIIDTATGELVEATNLLTTTPAGQSSAQGHFVDHIQPPAASTTFSVGLGPIVIDAIKICNGNQRESIPVKQPYSRQACTTGGSGPKTFTLGLDPLPEGLTLDSDTGEITGTPTVPGTYGFSVTVTDSTGSDIGEYTIVVLPEEDPIITDVTPASTPAPPKTNPVKAPKTVVSTQNNIFALAKRIPEPFAIGFPWFLLALALVLVGIQYYQVHSEAASTKRMQASVANQERLVDEQNNFVALSTHYLHTPLTVMEGEISLMVKAGTLTQDQANKLKSTLTSLNAEAEAVLAQEEQNE